MKTERCIATDKKKYSHARAMKQVRYLKYNKKYPDTVPQAYVCKDCGYWHVGNS